MIDTHCHLTDPRLHSQLDVVLARAAAAGVGRMITIATGVSDSVRCIELCVGRPQLRCCVGIHPGSVEASTPAEVPQLRELARRPGVVAIGEIGLDYHYNFGRRDLQPQVFQAQISLAAELGLPVVVHSRSAVDECLALLRTRPAVRAVFHCFGGSADEAARVLAAGHWISIAGMVTFKRADNVRDVVQITPLDRLMVETDSPYLSPEPMLRQKINEPALIVHTAAEIARLKGIPTEEFGRVSSANAAAFYGWPL